MNRWPAAGWRRWAALLFGLYILLYVVPLEQRPLLRREEVRYGQLAREMVQSGDWIVPHLNGIRYFEKPVLGTWLNALSIRAMGDTRTAVRLPGVLSTGLTALFLFAFLCRRTGSPGVGLLAAGIFLSAAGVFGIGNEAVLDTPLLLFLTLGLGSFYEACLVGGWVRTLWLILAGILCGLAALTKGFVAFAVTGVVALPFLAWERRWRDMWVMPWLPALTAAAVILPWALAVHAREPDFWRYFFWVEHVQRFLGEHAQHARPGWYFTAWFLPLALPWALLIPAVIRGLSRPTVERRLQRYLLVWFVMPFVFFSLSRGKLLTYILPCFPPFAMLGALGLRHYCSADTDRWLRYGAAAGACLFAALLAGLVAVQISGQWQPVFGPGETARWLLLAAVLALAVAAFTVAARSRVGRRSLAWFGCALLPFYLAVGLTRALPEKLLAERMPGELLRSVRAVTSSDAMIVSDARYFRSVAWFFDRADILMLDKGELAYGLTYADSRSRLLGREGLLRLLAQAPSNRPVLIIIGKRTARDLGLVFPATGTLTERGEMIVWRSRD